jgi:hypothetical protein
MAGRGEHHVGAEAAHDEVGGLVVSQAVCGAGCQVQVVGVVAAVAARGEGQPGAAGQPDGSPVVARVGGEAPGGAAGGGREPDVSLP